MLAFSVGGSAQNLVPNPGFEDHNSCPTGDGQVNRAQPWKSPTTTSPDYFSSCAGSNCPDFPYICVPANWTGHQMPHTGESYAGLFTYWAPQGFNFREYIQCPLISPMEAGVTYQVSMYVSLADTCQTATNGIGIGFTTDSVGGSIMTNLDIIPAIFALDPITDKNGWTKICGYYVALGGERYCTVGNFFDDAATVFTGGLDGGFVHSFYYIDDISVMVDAPSATDLTFCYGDTLVLTVSDTTAIWQGSVVGSTYLVTESGTYHVDVLSGDCPYSGEFDVTALDCPPQLVMPNIITPNDDGLNDGFVPVTQRDLTDVRLEILNRWGQLLFTTSDLQSGWDGKTDGKPCTEGVYFWKLQAVNGNGEEIEVHGYVTLSR